MQQETQGNQALDLGYNPESVSRVFNWQWYKEQMTGWTKSSYVLLVIGWLFLLYIGLGHGITGIGVTSTVAGLIGFTCTLSITNGRPINGVLGFVSAIMLIYVALKTGNFSDIIMQGFYIFLLDLPVLLNKTWNNGKDLEPRKMNTTFAFQTLLTFIGFFIVTYGLDTVILTSPRPIIDALSATIGLTGAILTVRRFRASYYFWFAQGLSSVILWLVTAMQGHAVWVLFFTYMLYIMNDLVAFFDSKWFSKSNAK